MKLHHVGIVVEGVGSAERYALREGLEKCGEIFEDPLQKVKLQFWRVPGDEVLIELIEPAGADSPAYRALQKGGGFNHLCYEVDDLDASVALALRQGAVQTREALPAIAFGGRRVAFVYSRLLGLIEFLEKAL